ncbi:MAG: hypothetical protein HY900_18735 [Deltaproteobacteria bacterium]|nr:hypothetical protein [Deltaproteobacteria bacterium]
MRKSLWLLGFLAASWAGACHAVDVGDISIHGFASQGYLKSSANNYLADTEKGSFEFNEAGINFSTRLSDRTRLGLQLFSRDLGDIGNNEVRLDWGYLDYHWRDPLGFRLGKVKIPFGLYNEVRDYDVLRTSILLPQSVYDETWRESLVAIQGGLAYGSYSLGALGRLDYSAYLGTSNIEAGGGIAETIEDDGMAFRDATVHKAFGGQLEWDAPAPGLLLSASLLMGDLTIRGNPGPGLLAVAGPLGLTPSSPMSFDIPSIVLSVWSAKYAVGGLTIAAEYARQKGHVSVDGLPALLGDQDIDRNTEGYYLQASYRLADWVELGGYYSAYYRDRDDKNGNNFVAKGLPDHLGWQKDWTVGARFDVTENWLFKLEAHFIDGTALLFRTRNPGGLERNWELFAVKTSFHF